jgi:hypothetical protein
MDGCRTGFNRRITDSPSSPVWLGGTDSVKVALAAAEIITAGGAGDSALGAAGASTVTVGGAVCPLEVAPTAVETGLDGTTGGAKAATGTGGGGALLVGTRSGVGVVDPDTRLAGDAAALTDGLSTLTEYGLRAAAARAADAARAAGCAERGDGF